MFRSSVFVQNTPEAAVLWLFWAAFAATWVVAALFTKRTVERSASFFGLVGALMLVALFALRRFHIADVELWPYSQPLGLIADVIAGLGLFMALWARFTLGRNWSGQVTFKEDHELITSGPYALARHPIYTGMILMLLGTAVLVGHSGAFMLGGAIAISLWLKSWTEEQLMIKHFGDAYRDYRRRVRALIPFVL
jgi:protein-S-isoprenylcysteine O-methyltransferase Ste14